MASQALKDMLNGVVTQETANFAKKQYGMVKEDLTKLNKKPLNEEEFERTMIEKTKENTLKLYEDKVRSEVSPEEIELISKGKLKEARQLKEKRIREALAKTDYVSPAQEIMNEISPKKQLINESINNEQLRKLIKEEVGDALLLETYPKDKVKSLVKECLLEIMKEIKNK